MRMEADGIMEGFKRKLRDLLERLGLLPAEGVHYIGGSDTLPPPAEQGAGEGTAGTCGGGVCPAGADRT